MKKKINKYDMGLIAGIIIINVLLIVYGGSQFVKSNNKTAYIYSENRLVREYVITDDIADEITIESETGGYNRLRIEGGQIWIQDASCPETMLYINLTRVPMGTAKKSKFILFLLIQRIISSGIKGMAPQYPPYA
jgi:hypothetical protein